MHPLRVGCKTAERLQQKERNFKANFAYFMTLPMPGRSKHLNFLIHLKYILRDKLPALKPSSHIFIMLIIKRATSAVSERTDVAFCRSICTLSCPQKATLSQITFQGSIFCHMPHIYQAHHFSSICKCITSPVICNVQAILWIGFLNEPYNIFNQKYFSY